LTVDQLQARKDIRTFRFILDDLPLAHDQLWLHLLPNGQAAGMGSRQRHGVFSHGNVLNLDVVDLLSTVEKPEADLYRTDEAIEADRQGRRLGVLPTLSQWVRLIDERMLMDGQTPAPPFALVTCGLACRFADQADEVVLWPIYPGYRCTELERTHWRKPTVVSHCRWLRTHSSYICDQDWAGVIIADLEDLLQAIQAVTGMIDRNRTMPCLTLTCGNVAYPQKGGAWYRCSGCDRAWSRAELIRHAERNAPRTLPECAKLLNIPERSLRRYLAQDPPPFQPVRGLKRGKSPLFDVKEVDTATRSLRYRNADQALVS
jgi:hypothetical protein